MPSITITVNKDARRRRSQRQTGTPLRGPSKKRYPARRKTGGSINFYDLGQVPNGSGGWKDIEWNFAETFGADPPSDGIDAFTDLSDWETLTDLILAVDPSDWKTSYRKLGYEDAEKYGLDLVDDDTSTVYPAARNSSRLDLGGNPITDSVWTAQGLKLPAAVSNFHFESYGAFLWWGQSNSFGIPFKITSSPDYSASSVAFPNLAGNLDVFLVPNVLICGATTDNSGYPLEMLFSGYRIMSRDFWLSRIYTPSGYPLLSYDPAGSLGSGDVSDLAGDLQTGARSFEVTGAGSSDYSETDPAGFPSLSGGSIGLGLDVTGAPFNIVRIDQGVFLGAIFKGGSRYYFWSDDSSWNVTAARTILLP